MKVLNKILYTIIAVALLSSCAKDDINVFDGDEYVYFNNQLVNYSFAYDPGNETTDIGFPLKLIGNSADYDRLVNFEVADRSENLEDSDFELLDGVFRKDLFEDTIYVRCYNSEKLLSEEVSLTIRIISGEDFQPGPTDLITAELNFSNKLIQPEWWNDAVTKDYLGTYSEKKFRTLIVATGTSDWTGLGESEKRSYAIMLANYIRENNVTEENGSAMVVTVKY